MYNFFTINEVNKKHSYFKNLVLSGGGTKGIIHLGVLSELIEQKIIIINRLKNIIGSSVGAIIGCLLIIGFKIDEIMEFLVKIDFSKLFRPNFLNIFSNYGIENGIIITGIISQILLQKTEIPEITFSQLFIKTKIGFHITGSCLDTKKTELFNHIETPNMKIIDAIRISISLPGFFTPIVLNEKTYIDGGVLNNYPINYFSDELDFTIGIYLCNNYNTNYDCPEKYFMALLNLFLHKHQELTLKNNQHPGTIVVDFQNIDVSFYTFNLTKINKINMFDLGKFFGKKYINKWKINYDDSF